MSPGPQATTGGVEGPGRNASSADRLQLGPQPAHPPRDGPLTPPGEPDGVAAAPLPAEAERLATQRSRDAEAPFLHAAALLADEAEPASLARSSGDGGKPQCPEGRPTIPPDGFSYTVSRARGTVVVTTCGVLDTAGSQVLDAALRDLVDDQGNLAVVLDVADLDLADPSCLSVLAPAVAAAARRNGELTLAHPSASVERALLQLGLAGSVSIRGRSPS